jgi:hypothetical protein
VVALYEEALCALPQHEEAKGALRIFRELSGQQTPPQHVSDQAAREEL